MHKSLQLLATVTIPLLLQAQCHADLLRGQVWGRAYLCKFNKEQPEL